MLKVCGIYFRAKKTLRNLFRSKCYINKGFNLKIKQSLKNDRNPLKVICSDKLQVKLYIAQKVGDEFVPKVFLRAKNVKDLLCDISNDSTHPKTYVMKANNDSGGVIVVRNHTIDQKSINRIEKYKNSVYPGYYFGEWYYKEIEYQCFTEEYLGENLTDYKFHCSNGSVRFCQVIRDRSIKQTNEVCVDLDGNCLDFHLDEDFKLHQFFFKPKNWEKMKAVATALCQDFDYVRVDMYTIDNQDTSKISVFVGELTFSPSAGEYRGEGQIEAGKLLFG